MSDGGSRQEAGLYRSPYNGAMDKHTRESACQALKRMEGRDSAKYSNARGMRCRDSTKYAQRGCIGEVAEALQSIQLGPSDTRSQS
jgi:hypothetical protein